MSNIVITERLNDETYSDYAYRVIRHNIMRLNLVPGSDIDEHELVQLLSVSRTPIHEALQRLRSEKLVDIFPRKKIIVTRINLSYVSEGSFWRCIVEPKLVEALIGNISSEYSALLWENLLRQKSLLESHSQRTDFFEVDDEFHKLIYMAANKPYIYSTKNYICSHLDRVRYLIRILGDMDLESGSYQHHLDIYNLIMFGVKSNRNIDINYEDSVTSFKVNLPSIIAKYPDYFEICK